VSGPHPAVAAVRAAVRRLLPPAGPVLVACSGGADSLALAAALAHEARGRSGLVTVDHGLQPGSEERAAAVAALGTTLGLDPAAVVPVVVRREHSGPEDAARVARLAALTDAAERAGAAAVLLGHTRDDQAEQVLLGLARGSGARSLAGMAPVRGVFRRPLLHLPRATTAAACAALGLAPWDDPHNRDRSYARARVRGSALPVLEAELGPGVAAALARTADLLRADADALDALAEQAHERCRAPGGGLAAAALEGLPAALRTRVLRLAAAQAGARSLSARHTAGLCALVTSWRGQGGVALPGGVVACRSGGRVLMSGPGRAP